MGSRGTAPLLNGLWTALNSYSRRQPLQQFMHKGTHLFLKAVGNGNFKICHIFSSGVLFTGLRPFHLSVIIFFSDGDIAFVVYVFTNKFYNNKAFNFNFRHSQTSGLLLVFASAII